MTVGISIPNDCPLLKLVVEKKGRILGFSVDGTISVLVDRRISLVESKEHECTFNEGEERGIIQIRKCECIAEVLSTGCVVLSGTIGGGEIVLRLLCDKDSLERLLSLSSVEVKSIRNYSEVTVLTPREEEVLRMAYELGFYDSPRKCGVRCLASKLQVSPSTISEIMRRTERKIIEWFLSQFYP